MAILKKKLKMFILKKKSEYYKKHVNYQLFKELTRALTPVFGNGAGAHGIGKISGILSKIGKFVLMYGVSIPRLIPII